MPRFGGAGGVGKRVNLSSLTRLEESRSSVSLAFIYSAKADWDGLFRVGILAPGNTYWVTAMCQVLCFMQKKIKFFLFGAEILIEKTDVQTIIVGSDKSLQDAVGPRGVVIPQVRARLSQTRLTSTTEIMLFIDCTKYP